MDLSHIDWVKTLELVVTLIIAILAAGWKITSSRSKNKVTQNISITGDGNNNIAGGDNNVK